MDSNEQLVPLDEGTIEYFKKAIDHMARGSLRCVAIAYRPLGIARSYHYILYVVLDGDVVCVVGSMSARVKVRMVTGDNLQTAKAIALECGILGSDADATKPNLIEGKSFHAMSDAQRLEVAERISVMGKSSPNNKLLLVQALRKRGHVFVVNGDGTDDAPALHEADIGLAMGTQGTEVAKESSDIIILDDNFDSVVREVINSVCFFVLFRCDNIYPFT
ncbi:putative P-type Ca(2+) transporter [Helianthus anomalus]